MQLSKVLERMGRAGSGAIGWSLVLAIEIVRYVIRDERRSESKDCIMVESPRRKSKTKAAETYVSPGQLISTTHPSPLSLLDR